MKDKPLIQSFSGSGAIGTILSSFLIQALEMEQVAIIHSHSLPPIAIVKDGIIEHPIRLFQSEELALLSCEIPISYNQIPYFLEMLVKYYVKKGSSYIVPVGGLPVLSEPANNAKCYAITTNREMRGFLKKKGIKFLSEGIIYGTIVETLELCEKMNFNSCFSLVSECQPSIPSYAATREILRNLAKIFNFKFDEQVFQEVSDEIKERIKESTKLLYEETMSKTLESHL